MTVHTAEVALNILIAVAYSVAACIANFYLVERLDRSEHHRSSRRGGSHARVGSMMSNPQSLGTSADASEISLASRSSGGGAGAAGYNQTPVKQVGSRTSSRGPHLAPPKSPIGNRGGGPAPFSQRKNVQSLSSHNVGQEDEVSPLVKQLYIGGAGSEMDLDDDDIDCRCQLGYDIPSGFGEIQSWFLIHVIASCLIQAVTVIVMGILEEDLSSATSDRLHQDLFTVPSAVAFFSLFALLLNVLHFLKDAQLSERQDRRVYWLRGVGAFGWIVGIYAVMSIIEANGVWPHCIEWGSTFNAALLGIAYLLSGPYLSKSVSRYGDSTALVAKKLQNVCFLVAFSMCVRFVLFFPDVQDVLGDHIGKYATCVLEMWMLIPYAASIQLLHQKSTNSIPAPT